MKNDIISTAENDNDVLLRVSDLRVSFKTDRAVLHAVEGVSFNVLHGETLGIVGESGCGKSISCMSILKLIQGENVLYEGGTIEFEGVNTLTMSDKQLQKIRGKDISVIFQEPMTALNPLYTIGDQMSEALKLHSKLGKKEIRDRCIEMLEKVRIPNPREIMLRYPFNLSGGMRQRVMIAMALLTNPKLVIADEPTTALDVTIQAQVLDVMQSLQREYGCSYIFITHDLGVISEMADRVAVMYGGHICECADTDTLFENPLHPYTRGLIASRPQGRMTQSRLAVIPGNVPSLANKPSGCPFHTRCPDARDCCRERFPETVAVDEGHTVACWNYAKK
ncbi:MAG: ABC transporter ATP-binding protein [Clostridiales bacterium]|nr:ABC transporter ATP-binding protein [Clostridiales bacterium]